MLQLKAVQADERNLRQELEKQANEIVMLATELSSVSQTF